MAAPCQAIKQFRAIYLLHLASSCYPTSLISHSLSLQCHQSMTSLIKSDFDETKPSFQTTVCPLPEIQVPIGEHRRPQCHQNVHVPKGEKEHLHKL